MTKGASLGDTSTLLMTPFAVGLGEISKERILWRLFRIGGLEWKIRQYPLLESEPQPRSYGSRNYKSERPTNLPSTSINGKNDLPHPRDFAPMHGHCLHSSFQCCHG